MADTKTSAETAASALDGTELIRGVQGGSNVKITGTQVKTFTSASPTLVTPVLGVATATSVNKVAITAPAASATLTIANTKTLTVSNDATVSGTNTGDQTITLTGDVTGSGTGSFAAAIANGAVTEAKQTLADNTTGNVSTSAHGYAPKAPNDATKYLDGSGAYSVPAGSGSVLRSYIAGVALSNDGGAPTTSLDVAAGQVADSTNAAMITVSAGVIDCTTTGANGLDAGSLANSTWYHVYVIAKAAGAAPALLASTSVSAPTLPATYTLKRRIGSFLTDGSAHILSFVQDGDTFYWGALVNDLSNVTVGTSATLTTLTVPTGVKVRPILRLGATAAIHLLVTSPDEPDVAAPNTVTGTNGLDFDGATFTTAGPQAGLLYTNTSAQLRLRQMSSTAGLYGWTRGWIDDRGRFN
jgi:hypothetical protein